MIPILLLAVAPLVTAKTLPPWFPNPGGIFDVQEPYIYNYDEMTFPADQQGHHVTVRGRSWESNLNTHKSFGKRWSEEGRATVGKVEAQLLGEGFRRVYIKEEPGRLFDAVYVRGQGEDATWLRLQFDFHSDGGNMRAVQIAPNPLKVELKRPAPTPESFTDKDDFPYLGPAPGMKLTQTAHRDKPLAFMPAPSGKPELVGSGHLVKDYSADPTISELAFRDAYVSALEKAGWTVTAGHDKSAFGVYAHYDKNGRDIYAYLSPRWHDIRVADVGAELASTLNKNCKAALYGINFDFDKATLRPDSEPVLAQVLKLMKDEPKLDLEIGGHTDNVGKPDYNMTLSDRRAAAVKEWLVAHGIAASRLSSRGYGDTQPVAPNDNDENRALNRRVELKKPRC